ncbi:hypothetical protein UFOVP407_44 [uncultured Caudovirales phage]|uniref:Uncharacterized protein n=1 Tax=uncultured Caudovirales phage TaxID=2100421 RepID=A0A6J5M0I0_9CAUD|nr:hypothetical protein UFOVP407_44 [uncultured Caudovirales phage]
MTCITAAQLYIDAIDIADREALLDLARALPATALAIPANAKVRQAASILAFEKKRQCPGKLWLDAKPFHPAIYRALRVDRQDESAAYACLPFRLGMIDGEHCILAALDCPKVTDDPLPRDIEIVAAWDPRSNRHSIIGEAQPTAIMLDDSHDTLFGDFFAFARAWVEARAAFFTKRQMQQKNEWVHPLPETSGVPGILVTGDVKTIRWPDMPKSIACIGLDPKEVNASIIRNAGLPRAWTTHTERAVA